MLNEAINAKVREISEKQKKEYIEFTDSLKRLVIQSERVLFLKELSKIRDEEPHIFFRTLKNVLYSVCFFPKEKIRKKLLKYQVPESTLSWFTPLKSIDRHFNKIEKKGILVLRHIALYQICLYIRGKINADLCSNFKSLNLNVPTQRVDIYKPLMLLYRRRKYRGKKPLSVKNDVDKVLNETANIVLESYKNPKKARSVHFDFVEGTTEAVLLKEMLKCFIPTKNMTQTELFDRLTPLFDEICQDGKFLTKSEIVNTDYYYDCSENQPRYNSHRIKSIVAFKPEDDFRHILLQERHST